jgi:hypothetical protein
MTALIAKTSAHIVTSMPAHREDEVFIVDDAIFIVTSLNRTPASTRVF